MASILNDATGIPKDDPNKDVQQIAYDLVDKTLTHLSKENGCMVSEFFDPYTREGKIALDILTGNGFTSFRNGYKDLYSIIDITEAGLQIFKMGGYRKFLDAKIESAKNNIEKENLELQELRTNVRLLTNHLADYEKTKSRTARNELIQWISILILAIGLIISLVKSM